MAIVTGWILSKRLTVSNEIWMGDFVLMQMF